MSVVDPSNPGQLLSIIDDQQVEWIAHQKVINKGVHVQDKSLEPD